MHNEKHNTADYTILQTPGNKKKLYKMQDWPTQKKQKIKISCITVTIRYGNKIQKWTLQQKIAEIAIRAARHWQNSLFKRLAQATKNSYYGTVSLKSKSLIQQLFPLISVNIELQNISAFDGWLTDFPNHLMNIKNCTVFVHWKNKIWFTALLWA